MRRDFDEGVRTLSQHRPMCKKSHLEPCLTRFDPGKRFPFVKKPTK